MPGEQMDTAAALAKFAEEWEEVGKPIAFPRREPIGDYITRLEKAMRGKPLLGKPINLLNPDPLQQVREEIRKIEVSLRTPNPIVK